MIKTCTVLNTVKTINRIAKAKGSTTIWVCMTDGGNFLLGEYTTESDYIIKASKPILSFKTVEEIMTWAKGVMI